MNENLNLVEILKDCPEGTKLYSTIFGEVEFEGVHSGSRTVGYTTRTGRRFDVTHEGKMFEDYDGECTLFPSKDQRDWSKFTAPWYKKDKFDPKTLQPFDKVLVRDNYKEEWSCNFFSHISNDDVYHPYITLNIGYIFCIPYNEDTKHLVGTKNEAPEYYRYWED